MEAALAVQRTPELIAQEINHLKAQTRNVVLYNAIEIGRRLSEAKQCIPHGEWGRWLESSVDYSQSTANNLMRIFEEYGADQMALFGETGPKSQALGKLGYTQAVALLAVPANEREQFIEEHEIEMMSTRELQQAIKDLNQARKELEEKEEESRRLQDEKEIAEAESRRLLEIQTALNDRLAKVQKQLTEAKAKNNNKIAEQLQQSLEETDAELMESQKRIEELEQQLKAKPIDVPATTVLERLPESVEKELAELRKAHKDRAVVKFQVIFEDLVKGFSDLLGTLTEIVDQEDQEKYKTAVAALIDKMRERL